MTCSTDVGVNRLKLIDGVFRTPPRSTAPVVEVGGGDTAGLLTKPFKLIVELPNSTPNPSRLTVPPGLILMTEPSARLITGAGVGAVVELGTVTFPNNCPFTLSTPLRENLALCKKAKPSTLTTPPLLSVSNDGAVPFVLVSDVDKNEPTRIFVTLVGPRVALPRNWVLALAPRLMVPDEFSAVDPPPWEINKDFKLVRDPPAAIDMVGNVLPDEFENPALVPKSELKDPPVLICVGALTKKKVSVEPEAGCTLGPVAFTS